MEGVSQNGSIYVWNLPPGTDEILLAEYFGTIGILKKDKRTGRPKIWIYRDKTTNEPKGDAMITYDDPYSAAAAVEWFNNKEFHGSLIGVSIAETKNKDQNGHSSGVVAVAEEICPIPEAIPEAGRGRGKGEPGGKAWQQEGDWLCPNPSCSNVNFSFRGVCNRCGTPRPAGSSGGGGMGGRGRGRRSAEGEVKKTPLGPPGLFGPNDWPCPMCGNVNWAKRSKCNICNTSKPGTNEGGVREGRAGGYKEYDEAEIEETKRRRRELEEDDGEIYDEFGNLKKKFRAKAKQGEGGHSQSSALAAGKSGWEKEDLGIVERDKGRDNKAKEWSKPSEYDRNGERDGYNGSRSHREEDYGNSYDSKDRERGMSRHEYERGRHSEGEKREKRDRDWDRSVGRKDADRERERFREDRDRRPRDRSLD